MTRAESWLIVAAAGKIETGENGSWFTQIREAAPRVGGHEQLFFDAPGWRIETGDWGRIAPDKDATQEAAPLPDWVHLRPRAEARDVKPLSPSDLGGAKALPGEGLDEEEAKARGRRLHLLLEHLPEIAKPAWSAAAPGILAGEGTVEDAEAGALLQEAVACLTAPHLAAIFAEGALAEVSLTADSPTLGRTLVGQIDRLILTDTRLLAVDFKSNAVCPEGPEEVPEGLLRQMGAYAEMLAAIYPGKTVETAILWTREARLMPLPSELTTPALTRARDALP